jgi:DNA-binding PadR family transcriptional regulator
MLRELYLGFIRVHILFHAAEGSVYGAALMEELARHGYQVGPGTLYPILHALQSQGYLRREERIVNGRVRKYYRATPAGRRTLVRAQTQLWELVEEVLPPPRPKGPGRGLGVRRKARWARQQE